MCVFLTLCFAFVHTELMSWVKPIMEVQIWGKKGILASNAKFLPWCLQSSDCLVQISFHRWEIHRLERLVPKVTASEAVNVLLMNINDHEGVEDSACNSVTTQQMTQTSAVRTAFCRDGNTRLHCPVHSTRQHVALKSMTCGYVTNVYNFN